MERGVGAGIDGREGLIEPHLGAENEEEDLQNEGKYLQELVTILLVIIVGLFELDFKLLQTHLKSGLKSNICFQYFTGRIFAPN